mmetsp:Transcript_1069/g.4421  ORF Transcript_1069/g.4421 Transcript_1069/m.4421 type:complete len:243 (-) Transcript_1069:1346-2074(-)
MCSELDAHRIVVWGALRTGPCGRSCGRWRRQGGDWAGGARQPSGVVHARELHGLAGLLRNFRYPLHDVCHLGHIQNAQVRGLDAIFRKHFKLNASHQPYNALPICAGMHAALVQRLRKAGVNIVQHLHHLDNSVLQCCIATHSARSIQEGGLDIQSRRQSKLGAARNFGLHERRAPYNIVQAKRLRLSAGVAASLRIACERDSDAFVVALCDAQQSPQLRAEWCFQLHGPLPSPEYEAGVRI